MAWSDEAWVVLRELAGSGGEFTADDLLERVGFPDESHSANGGNNKVGSVFRRASSGGLIEPVGVSRSRVPTRKGGLVRVWRGVSGPVGLFDGEGV